MNLLKVMGSVKRGALIVVEGVDRSGKSTQCKLLVESLQKQNIKAQQMNFPDRSTKTGQLINEYLTNKDCKLNDNAIHLLFAANRWESVDKIKELLYEGVTLVVDRYSYSGIAFSAIKKQMDVNWCKQPENGLPKPDLVFLFKLSLNELAKRPGFGGERYENILTQNEVAAMFDKLCDTNDNWKIVNTSGSIDEVNNLLLKEVLHKIDEVEMTPIKYLNFDEN